MKPISRTDAKDQGLKRYFTGLPCKRGHVAERDVSNLECVECRVERQRRRYKENPEAGRERTRKWRAANPEKNAVSNRECKRKGKDKNAAYWASYYEKNREALAEKSKVYREENREAVLHRQRKWREQNVARRTALEARREARKLQAVPPWFGELDAFAWEEAADLVIRRRGATGVDWHADHMIPLAARKACGLHVASNCQVIPAKLNVSKNNKLILTQPREWIQHL